MATGRSWVELDRQALASNFANFQRLLGEKAKIAAVVKANAYGHGTQQIVKNLEKKPIWGFCVASGEEGLELRSKTRQRVLVMSSWQPAEIADLIRRGVQIVAWDLASARLADRIAQRIGRVANVHVKIDTGAGRIGIRPEDVMPFVEQVQTMTGIRVVGVFSHFADSEENHGGFTESQLHSFIDAAGVFPQRVEHHIACTAAAVRYPASWLSFVRLGIGLYGLWPSETTRRHARRRWPRFQLRPVLQWITTLQQTKWVSAGSTVGYGRTFRTRRKSRLGVIPVGYWDGYDRQAFSNQATVLVGGRRVPVLGRVSMNLTTIDLTDVPKAHVGDRVTLIGQQGSATVTADELAHLAKTIHYEVVTRINPRLPRVLV